MSTTSNLLRISQQIRKIGENQMLIADHNVIEENIIIEPEVKTILSDIEQVSDNKKDELGDKNQAVSEHFLLLKSDLQEIFNDVEQLISKDFSLETPDELEALEKEIIDKTDKLAGLILGSKIQEAFDSQVLQEESKKLIKMFPKKMKNQGVREIKIHPLRGECVVVKTAYYSQKSKKDKRKKNRHGCYPCFVLLGIYDHLTPGLSSEICLMSTALSSFEEAQAVLLERGKKISVKTIRNITVRYGERCRLSQSTQDVFFSENVSGCRVVISTDGGRIRIREKKRGPKTKKGRSHYTAAWREPKVLIIYTVNEDGRMDRSFTPLIDGTLKKPDDVFALIKYYLEKVGICSADKILFIADGARWIWNRVAKLMNSLGVKHWYELLDFYHAVEHLGKVANLQKKWKKGQRKRWITKYRRLLLRGKAKELIQQLRQLCRGKKNKDLRRERNYFIRNHDRLSYQAIAQEGLPIGSGSIESAVRRVVNLRLKSASTYWLRQTAEAMLMLRSYYKAGRWNCLKKLSFPGTLLDVN